jgi:hypothetical protein
MAGAQSKMKLKMNFNFNCSRIRAAAASGQSWRSQPAVTQITRTQQSALSIQPRPAGYDWSGATGRAIDLSIRSGLFLAPRRVLLDMAAETNQQSQAVSRPEEIVGRKAA